MTSLSHSTTLHHQRAFSPQYNKHTAHTKYTLRVVSLQSSAKLCKVRHKFHERSMLTTTNVTAKTLPQHPRKCFNKQSGL